jgi:hypothetical protein
MEAGESVFDIRLINESQITLSTVLMSNFAGSKIKRLRLSCHTSDSFRSSSIHVFHAGGWQGEFTLGLDLCDKTARGLFEMMTGIPQSKVDDAAVNDAMAEILNQIGGNLIKKARDFGYTFQRIYHGAFSRLETVSYILKGPGFYIRSEMQINDLSLVYILGVRSGFASAFANAWPFLRQQKEFEIAIQSSPKVG